MLFEAFVGDVEDGVFVGGLVVDVEDYVGFGMGMMLEMFLGLGLTLFFDRDVHVAGVSFEQVHGSEAGQVPDAFGLEGVAVVALEGPGEDSVLDGAGVVLLGLDDLAGELDAFEPLAEEVVDVDEARVDHHAHGVAVGGVGVVPVDVALQELGVVPFDVLGGDDDLDLAHGSSTDWLANWYRLGSSTPGLYR